MRLKWKAPGHRLREPLILVWGCFAINPQVWPIVAQTGRKRQEGGHGVHMEGAPRPPCRQSPPSHFRRPEKTFKFLKFSLHVGCRVKHWVSVLRKEMEFGGTKPPW